MVVRSGARPLALKCVADSTCKQLLGRDAERIVYLSDEGREETTRCILLLVVLQQLPFSDASGETLYTF